MNNLLLYSIIFFISVSCNKSISLNQINSENLKSDSLIRLHNWYILTPFYPDTNISVLKRIEQDLLTDYGAMETKMLEIDDFTNLGKDLLSKDTSMIFKQIHVPNHILNLADSFKIAPPITAYLATNIKSTEDCNVTLNISAYQSAKFWLNGKEVYNIEWKRGRNSYIEDFATISLKKGNNFLLVKLSASDKIYKPTQWKFEVDISNNETAKKIFLSCHSNQFIRRSLIGFHENLNLYTGPFSTDRISYTIYRKYNGEKLLTGQSYPNIKSGISSIDLSQVHLTQGLYTCEIQFGKQKLTQDFFVGDLDRHLDNLKLDYNRLEGLSKQQKLNIYGIIRRMYLDVRRDSSDFDDQVEYWNRLRIPNIGKLEAAIQQLKENKISLQPYFLRSYYSDYWKGYNYYSTHIPLALENTTKLPVFILLIDSETETRNWEAHYRNTLARWILDTEIIADELGFIAIWTDCGGRIETKNKLSLFKEILDNALTELPADPKKVFIVGNCASTKFSIDVLNNFPGKIAGCGLINPEHVDSQYFNKKNKINDHKLTMIYAKHDEVIDQTVSLSVYEKLKKIDPFATLYMDNYSSHNNAPSNYTRPLFLNLINRTSKPN